MLIIVVDAIFSKNRMSRASVLVPIDVCREVPPSIERRSPRSPLAVRRENVILGRHSRMACEAAIDDAVRIGLERVRRGIIIKHGVCPSLRGRESLAVLLDQENVL